MKRLILTSIIVLSMSCISFASDKEMTNEEYINILNNYVGEMRGETDIKEGSLIKSFTKGVDEGYLIPDINRLEALVASCEGIADNMKGFKLKDKEMQVKHDELVNKYYKISDSLNEVLVAKRKVLNKDLNAVVKLGKVFVIDGSKTYFTNEEIKELNKLYKDINKSL